MDVVKILNFGFSGFAFLLAWMAYRLLLNHSRNDKTQRDYFKTVYRFMIFSIVLGCLSILSPFAPKLFESHYDTLLKASAENLKQRQPLPIDFVKSQIANLASAHDQRLEELYRTRAAVEANLRIEGMSRNKTRVLEASLRRIENNIRQENQDFSRKVREFKSML